MKTNQNSFRFEMESEISKDDSPENGVHSCSAVRIKSKFDQITSVLEEKLCCGICRTCKGGEP